MIGLATIGFPHIKKVETDVPNGWNPRKNLKMLLLKFQVGETERPYDPMH